MADWFKLQENWFVEPRLQWAIKEQQSVVTVWLWCLTECCRIGSDTIGLHQEDFEMLGIQQLLNLSPGIFNSGINLLEKIKYIQIDRTKNSLKVVKWTEFQSEYLSRKNRGDYNDKTAKRTKTPKVSDTIGEPPPEERRVEEIRREEKEESETSSPSEPSVPQSVASLPQLLGENSIPEETVKAGEKALRAEKGSSKRSISKPQNLPIGYAWCREYEKFHSKPYVWSYGDDKAVSLLETSKISIEDMVTVMRSTWNNQESFWFGKVHSLKFFASQYNVLRSISDSYRKTELKPSKPTGCFAEDES